MDLIAEAKRRFADHDAQTALSKLYTGLDEYHRGENCIQSSCAVVQNMFLDNWPNGPEWHCQSDVMFHITLNIHNDIIENAMSRATSESSQQRDGAIRRLSETSADKRTLIDQALGTIENAGCRISGSLLVVLQRTTHLHTVRRKYTPETFGFTPVFRRTSNRGKRVQRAANSNK